MNCPHCHRLLYDRRRRTCGFCERDLPAECMFSEDELADLDEAKAALAERRARDQAKEEEERKNRPTDDGGSSGFHSGGMFSSDS